MTTTIPNDYLSDEVINKRVNIIMTQTNYDETIALEKLKEFNYDYMNVIKNYMGIPEKKINPRISSINQEIYKQIRYNLDSNMKQYREQNPINIEQVMTNLNESEEREREKGQANEKDKK
jgi:hypothetical protein